MITSAMFLAALLSAILVTLAVRSTGATIKERARPWILWFLYSTAVFAFPIGLFVGVVVGGNYGGSIASHFFEASTNGSIYITAGIGLGMLVITSLATLLATVSLTLLLSLFTNGVGFISNKRKQR